MVIINDNVALMPHFKPVVCQVLANTANTSPEERANANAAVKELNGILAWKTSKLLTSGYEIHFVHGPQQGPSNVNTAAQMGSLLKDAGYKATPIEHTSGFIGVAPAGLSDAQRQISVSGNPVAGPGCRSAGQASGSNHQRVNETQSAGEGKACRMPTGNSTARPINSTTSQPTASSTSKPTGRSTAKPTITSKTEPMTDSTTAQPTGSSTTKSTISSKTECITSGRVTPTTTSRTAPISTSKAKPTSKEKTPKENRAKGKSSKGGKIDVK